MDGNMEAQLSALGLNIEQGLEYCGGMEEFYLEVLQEYADSAVDEATLKQYLDSGEFKEYRTLVHGIKSSSKTIGATDMSSRAEKLEFAARDEDVDYINAHQAEFMKVYKDLIAGISALA